jgi:hypothetical protein
MSILRQTTSLVSTICVNPIPPRLMSLPLEFGSSASNAGSAAQAVTPFTRVTTWHAIRIFANEAYFSTVLLTVPRVFNGI